MISEGGVKLGNPIKIKKTTFFSVLEEEELDSFIIALAAWFNDLKTYVFHGLEANARAAPYNAKVNRGEKPTNEEEMNARLSGSYGNHAFRLIASHLIELLNAVKENEKLLKHPLFAKSVNSIARDRKINWFRIAILAEVDDLKYNLTQEFINLRNLLVRMRASGTYHYDKIKYFKKGYLYHHNKPANDPYYCTAESPPGTRFFFADRVQEAILNEFQENYPEEAFINFVNVAQYAIKDLVEAYIKIKESRFVS